MYLFELTVTEIIYKMKSTSFWTVKSQQIAVRFIYKQEKGENKTEYVKTKFYLCKNMRITRKG